MNTSSSTSVASAARSRSYVSPYPGIPDSSTSIAAVPDHHSNHQQTSHSGLRDASRARGEAGQRASTALSPAASVSSDYPVPPPPTPDTADCDMTGTGNQHVPVETAAAAAAAEVREGRRGFVSEAGFALVTLSDAAGFAILAPRTAAAAVEVAGSEITAPTDGEHVFNVGKTGGDDDGVSSQPGLRGRAQDSVPVSTHDLNPNTAAPDPNLGSSISPCGTAAPVSASAPASGTTLAPGDLLAILGQAPAHAISDVRYDEGNPLTPALSEYDMRLWAIMSSNLSRDDLAAVIAALEGQLQERLSVTNVETRRRQVAEGTRRSVFGRENSEERRLDQQEQFSHARNTPIVDRRTRQQQMRQARQSREENRLDRQWTVGGEEVPLFSEFQASLRAAETSRGSSSRDSVLRMRDADDRAPQSSRPGARGDMLRSMHRARLGMLRTTMSETRPASYIEGWEAGYRHGYDCGDLVGHADEYEIIMATLGQGENLPRRRDGISSYWE